MSERDAAALDAVVTISRALGEGADLASVLDLVAKRGRALVAARAVAIEIRDKGRVIVAAVAGDLPEGLVTARQVSGSVLMVPLALRGRTYGALVAIDSRNGGPRFTIEDEELLEALAPLAAGAVAGEELGRAGRPVLLDNVGLGGAIELLADLTESPRLEIRTHLKLAFEEGRADDRRDSEMESAVYHFVQESLARLVKCPGVSQLVVEVLEDDDREEMQIEVRSNGDGGPRIAATVPSGQRWRSMLNID